MALLGSMVLEERLNLADFSQVLLPLLPPPSWSVVTTLHPKVCKQRDIGHPSLHSIPLQGFTGLISLFFAAMVSAEGKK